MLMLSDRSCENSRLQSAKTRGWVVQLALAPRTCSEIGKLKLTMPFSKKLSLFLPNIRATMRPRVANKRERERWVNVTASS